MGGQDPPPPTVTKRTARGGRAMAEQDIRQLAQDWLQAQSTGDYTRMGATLAEDVIYDELGTQRRGGRGRGLVGGPQAGGRSGRGAQWSSQELSVVGQRAQDAPRR